MKRISLLIASHALLLAAGYGWHRSVAGRQPGPPPPARQQSAAAKPVERKPGSVTTVMGEAPWTGGECRKAWQAVLKGMANRGEDRFHEILDRDDLPADVRPAALVSFAEGIARSPEPAKALEQFRKLSPADQSAIGPALLDQAKAHSFACPSAVTNALTMLVESGQGKLLEAKGAEAIEHFFKSSKPNPEAVARWALQLPASTETAATFRAAISPRFRQDLLQGAEWARSLPAGWHRDQALAQLAITAGASATRDAAMAEITDPAIQAELRRWLQNQPQTK